MGGGGRIDWIICICILYVLGDTRNSIRVQWICTSALCGDALAWCG